jgi:hypothetical protein
MIDFSVEPEFQEKLDWMDKFVREECETMDLLWPEMAANFDTSIADARRPLKPAAWGVCIGATVRLPSIEIESARQHDPVFREVGFERLVLRQCGRHGFFPNRRSQLEREVAEVGIGRDGERLVEVLCSRCRFGASRRSECERKRADRRERFDAAE